MKDYIPAFDGVRAVAAFAVLAFHVNSPDASGGFLGVDVFFVLSGFLTASMLLPRRRGIGYSDIWDFIVRRFRRLWPLLAYVSLTTALMLSFAGKAVFHEALAAVTFAANMTLLASDYPKWLIHTWTLAAEMQFYLLLALLVWITSRRRLSVFRIVLAGGFLAVTACRTLAGLSPMDWTFGFYSPLAHTSGLFLGALLATYRIDMGRYAELLAAGALAVLIAAFATAEFNTGDALLIWIPVTEAASAVLLLCLAGSRRGLLTGLFRTRVMRTLGLWSYGIYLWHYPIAKYFREYLDPLETFAITATVSIALAALTFKMVEEPFRFRRGFSLPPGPKTVAQQ